MPQASPFQFYPTDMAIRWAVGARGAVLPGMASLARGAIPPVFLEKAQFFLEKVGKRRDDRLPEKCHPHYWHPRAPEIWKGFGKVTNSMFLNHCNVICVLIDWWLLKVWKRKYNYFILYYISVSTPVSEQLARRRVETNSVNTIEKLPEKIENKLMKKGRAHHIFYRFLKK